MKILMITDLYPVKEDEVNTPKTLYNFVKSWELQGHKVDVIKPNFLLNSFIRRKPFYKTGWYGNVYNVNYFTPFWFNIKNKLKGIDIDGYDRVFAHMPSGEIFALHLGIDFTAGVHASDFDVLTKPLYRFYFKKELEKAHKKAAGIACRSIVLKNRFIKEYPMYISKTFTALSGVDMEPVTTTIKQKPRYMDGIKSDFKRVLTCANLIKRKNVDKVIEACKNIDGVQLTVIGDGAEKQKLMRMSADVVFLGHLSHDRVLERMRASDIFVLPSVHETFGLVYIEAMSCGCVTVCTKGDGIDGIIEDGVNGFVCGVDELETKLREIIKRPDLKEIAKRAVETAEKYTNETCAQNYLEAGEAG